MNGFNFSVWMVVLISMVVPVSSRSHQVLTPGQDQIQRNAKVASSIHNIQAVNYQSCGTWSVQEPLTSTYQVYATQCGYTSTPFLITDLRADDGNKIYSNKENFETRNATIYRAQKDGQWKNSQPVVVFIHGGAWTDGYADWYSYVSESFTGEKGWVTVVVDYRLTSDQVYLASPDCLSRSTCLPNASQKAAWYPDNINDVASSIQWVYSHIADYGGDPEQIFLFGHSAGGHLVSLAMTHPDYEFLRSEISGWISMSGAYDLRSPETQAFFSASMGQTFKNWPLAQEQLQDASPMVYLVDDMGLPPILLLYAENELPTLEGQSLDFATALNNHSYQTEIHVLPGYDHTSEMAVIWDVTALPTQYIVEFIEKHRDHSVYLPVISKESE